MQSVHVYPLWQQVSLATPARGGIIAYLRALTVTVWFGSLVYNFWWRQNWDWFRQFHEQDVNIRDQYMVGFAIALAGHLTLGVKAWFDAPFQTVATVPGKMFTLFCVLMLVTAPLSASMKTSGLYAIATWLVLMLCHLYWASDYDVVRRVLVFSGLFLFAWLLLLLFRHGLTGGFGGGIGGINRNSTSSLAMAGAICCCLSRNRMIRWGGIAFCAFFAVLVTSRGTLVALAVFLTAYYTIYKGTTRAALHGVLALVLVAAVLLASSFLSQFVFEDVMRLHDKSRGLGTGFTGRMESWQRGIATFWKSPLIGHGFRAHIAEGELGSHSGYIRLLIETGLIGTGLAVATVVIEALRRLTLAKRLRDAYSSTMPGIDLEQSFRVNAVACAAMLTVLTYWVYEPMYLNLGTVMSLIFFLMFAAPEYVASRRSWISA